MLGDAVAGLLIVADAADDSWHGHDFAQVVIGRGTAGFIADHRDKHGMVIGLAALPR